MNGIARKENVVVPSAIKPAQLPDIIAAQIVSATNWFILNCFAAEAANKNGRKVKIPLAIVLITK